MIKETNKGRGMLRIDTWMPCRRPGKPRDPSIKPVNIRSLVNRGSDSAFSSNDAQNGSIENGPKVPPTLPSTSNGPAHLIAKYNYQANPNQPGGFEEMSLTAGEKLQFVCPHSENPYWWQAIKENDQTAYVPASYVMVLEEKVTSLPWLEEKRAEKERQEKERAEIEDSGFGQPSEPAVFKPYQSAYNKSGKPASESASNFYCEICDKTLNGIKPYQAHMVSKDHKEEVKLAEIYRS